VAYGFRNVRTVYNHFLLLIYRARARSISPTLMISSVRAHGAYDKTMVRSLLDYCVSVWVSYKKGDIEVLEKVQKKATKIIPEIKTFAIQGSS